MVYIFSMVLPSWLQPSLVLLGVPATTLDAVLSHAARALAPVVNVPATRIGELLREVTSSGGVSVGAGVAVPHARLPDLSTTAVALLVTTQPIPVQAMDGQPADIFFVVLSGLDDPRGHLLVLAHLARLAHSQTLLQALRQAKAPREALELIEAAELRHAAGGREIQAPQRPSHYVAIIAVAGEKAVDSLLVGLLDQGFENASMLEAQSLREAATREVPLFAGFRDIFGDPGGRRIILVDIEVDRADELVAMVHRICEDRGAESAELALVPLQHYWRWERPRADRPARGGH